LVAKAEIPVQTEPSDSSVSVSEVEQTSTTNTSASINLPLLGIISIVVAGFVGISVWSIRRKNN
jgi:hypothetical protein